ncbi:MAG: RNA polymerase sigma-70 factor [Actinomycetota bacterium]
MSRIETFEEQRSHLFALAYRMLGSVRDAEDVVQEAFIRWEAVDEEVAAPKAYLSKIVTRLCIDHLRSARVQRETYVGPWLPEPLAVDDVPGPEASAEQADSLSMAFLVVLESLNPTERAVFLLREVFEHDYAEIAEIVGLTETNCRQIAHRAKQHVASRRPRFSASKKKRDEITYRFLEACALGEMDPLMELLAEDAAVYSDGGGRARAARKPILGAAKVGRFLVGIVKKAPPTASMRVMTINAQPAIALYEDGNATTVMTIDLTDEGVQAIHIVVNPDKLAHLADMKIEP